ncbi:AAA family ATPase (plasmid) [Sphingomonas panacis]|uniref:AAA family ATPase n=1 Tax=Sphingomonas panacis TaxID=1560345 RepID=A0A1B3ZIA9_9SPHN|nr:ATP-binding protein [Sphingomonas panacis]AOH87159.1 AAA family ATPase [Sphingomonas panacis]
MLHRHSANRVREALQDTRVVLLAGPRQAGKTTLARLLAEKSRTYLTLDDATTLSAAKSDPAGLIRELDQVIIDEVQRAPALLLAIKESVDRDPRPGRFLIIGSANLMTLPHIADSLAGRMETIRLLPLSQSEILAQPPPRFLASLFAGRAPQPGPLLIGSALVDLVLAGGYPEAVARKTWTRRQDWYANYVDAVVDRDVRDIANIDQLDRMPRLLRALAVHSGQLINHAGVGASLDINHVTTQKYTGIFEQLFLVRTLPPWHNNALKRLTKKPKLHFLDSGLLAALINLTPEKVAANRASFRPILETFVFSEVLKLASWSENRLTLSHFRDKELDEVDIVIEDRDGRIVGLEIKAAATVRSEDFSGLRKLAAAVGERFAFGAVLYDHERTVAFGDRLAAIPLSSLWG